MSRSLNASGRRRSSSLTADNALYHAIPQAPVAANPTVLPPSSDIELDSEALEASDELAIPTQTAPADARIRWIHFILGCAVLLPWNALITATPYFLSRLADSSVRTTFGSYLTTSFTAANFCVLGYATVTAKEATSSRRIFLSTLWLAFLTLLLTISTYMHVSSGLFFAFVLSNGILQASAGSFLQSSVIALASFFGPTTVQAVMSGQGAVAVVVSGVQVLSAAASLWGASPESISTNADADGAAERSAFIFFALSTVFLVATTASHAWLTTLPAYKTVVVPFEQRTKWLSSDRTDPHERQGLVSSGPNSAVAGHTGDILRVAKANVTYEIAVAYVYVVTLAVFPPITTSIQSTSSINPLLFSAIHFLVFNIGDFAGRSVCAFPQVVIWNARRLLSLSLARTLFIPLFLMCNIQRSPSSPASPPIISSDTLYMFILLLFGLSNGYVSSLCMMSAPSVEHNPQLKGRREDVDIAATVATFCLIGGLAVGSMGSFAVRAAVCGCNPFIG